MNMQLIEKIVFADSSSQAEDAIMEIPVLLEAEQLTALEAAASAHGLTAGALVHCLLREFLSSSVYESAVPCPSAANSQSRYG
jgi:hypothetical protein